MRWHTVWYLDGLPHDLTSDFLNSGVPVGFTREDQTSRC